MIKVFTCIQSAHNVPLLVLAGGVCLFGCYICVRLFERCLRSKDSTVDWLALSALAGGVAIWSTHFVSVLAYLQEIETAYAAPITMISLLSAIATTAVGLSVVRLGKRFLLPELGGALVGLGGSLMHFIGMLAYDPIGQISLDMEFVSWSIVFSGISGAITGTILVRRPFVASTYIGVGFLSFCIVGLHFIAMTAMEVVPDSTNAVFPTGLSRAALAVAVAIVSILVIGSSFFAYLIDGRNKHRSNEQISFASHHDLLTGLPNRTAFEREIETRLEVAVGRGHSVVVYKVNVSCLNEVNAVMGEKGGDQLLIEVSRRLMEIPARAYLARLSGTRFVLVVDGGDAIDSRRTAEQISTCLSSALEIDRRPVKIRFDVGVVVFPNDGNNRRQLMANANVALERARHLPGNSICFYNEATDKCMHRRRALSQDIQNALDGGQFELHFQPQCELGSMKLIGFEGLLRWRHPEFGMVSPAEFIPIAEQSGMIVEIGDWVLREGCRIASSWPQAWKVALNLSPLQLKSANISQSVLDALSSCGLSSARLELEITESTLIESPEETLKQLQGLQRLGVSIALDDFGAGYSSLSTLASFPFDKIKLDKSFLGWERPTIQAEAVIGALLKMGQKLGMKILVEGVETAEHLDFLRAEGCDYAQGYLIGKPMPADEIEGWVPVVSSPSIAQEHPQKCQVAV